MESQHDMPDWLRLPMNPFDAEVYAELLRARRSMEIVAAWLERHEARSRVRRGDWAVVSDIWAIAEVLEKLARELNREDE